ncbi:hypothetical protein LguiB_025711 [Lonicera macranthoides]
MFGWPAACFTNSDEVLLSVITRKYGKRDKKLIVYNPGNMTFRNLPACGISDWWEDMIYVETLVSPNGGRGALMAAN